MDRTYFHNASGHINTDWLVPTALGLGVNLTGRKGKGNCFACARGKMKKASTWKQSKTPRANVGERIMFDGTSPNKTSMGGKKFAHFKYCQGSKRLFVSTHKKKNEFFDDAYNFVMVLKKKNKESGWV